MISPYQSFGRYPNVKNQEVHKLFWLNELPELNSFERNILPYGLGKSYGDSCLNEDGVLLDTSNLNRFISFDKENGIIRTESGVTLSQLLELLTENGYFLAATPGTKNITVGGAIGNDVHGKNHHKGGTFGTHLTQFEILRSDGNKYLCSPTENPELFSATIGGLGLTGLITWAEFKVQKVPSEYIKMESIKFDSLEEFFEINEYSNKHFDYTVSWIDTTAIGSNLGRGLFSRGNFAEKELVKSEANKKNGAIPFIFDYPFINPVSVQAFNSLYFNKQLNKKEETIVHYNPFFYPLDAVNNWQLAYGKNGFLQYQFVIPFDNVYNNLRKILEIIVGSGLSSFLTVLKQFGNVKSPGMLSFPRHGITLAIDFAMKGREVLDVLNITDEIVKDAGGVIYPGKDARMSAENFKIFYPQSKEFIEYIDPKFSSSFWRRVMAD